MVSRPLREIRSIEVTSRCNLACVYCIHPTMPRPKLDMSTDTWAAALTWVRYFIERGQQGEVNLSGVGEPILHPLLPQFCAELRALLGPDRSLQFTTNGRGLTEDLVRALAPSHPAICVTAHHAHLAGPAAALLARYGLLRSISFDPVAHPQDWAGQLIWPHPPRPVMVCAMLLDGLGFVSADGKLYTCCMDTSGESSLGTVYESPSDAVLMREWRVCPQCWQSPPTQAEVERRETTCQVEARASC